MRNIYKAITIPTAQSNLCIYNKDGKPEYLVSENQFIRYGEFHPQYLVIAIDERPKFGEWCYSVRGWIGKFGEHENSYPEECKKIIASNHPSINNITLSDLKYYVELGCPDMISLEMEDKVKSRIEHSCKKMRCDCNNKEYCSSNSSKVVDYSIPQLKLIDSCVVFAREEKRTYKNTGHDLSDLAQKAMDKILDKQNDVPDTNVGKMDESELNKIIFSQGVSDEFVDTNDTIHNLALKIAANVKFAASGECLSYIVAATKASAEWQKQQHPKPVEGDELKRIFLNKFDCYADTIDESVVPAMTKERFIEVVAQYVLNNSWDDEDMMNAYNAGHRNAKDNKVACPPSDFLTQYKTSKL